TRTAAATATRAFAARRTAFEDLFRLAFGARNFLARRLIDDLHRQPRFAAIVKAQELDVNLLAFLHDFADRRRPAGRKLRDVYKAVLRAEEVHERAELHDLHDLALVDLADFGLRRDAADAGKRLVDALAVCRCDLHRAVILDIDLGTRFRDDLADDRAARTDDFADLVDRDLDRLDARRKFAELFTCTGERLRHFAEDVNPARMRLIERDTHDLFGDAGDLDVHLQRGHAVRRTRNLEVHIAEVVFIAENVGQDGEVLAFLDEP